eukprot:CAMPEP_0196572452 /NCGR_PEP_ID=MMETSP1081-20130531/2503_1 /TAXON_ID=36882 /ORGANISM="Pyramimonas amylifera, Strain CCMP720" /LENGTH=225 /DNA_ID=CAMNT_0041889783 /DNA_START=102 /DNA_END=779 /DNA_ORIENTATION=+
MWLPLESNPELLTDFAERVGLPVGTWVFSDVLGLDAELLCMVPAPCKALTLLFPIAKMGPVKQAQAERIQQEGQHVSDQVFFIKQLDSVGNACGTIAAVHALVNSGAPVTGALADFLAQQKQASPEERGLALSEDSSLKEASEDSAQGGQTETPDRDAEVEHHFITFVPVDGHLYELDGRKEAPINHGPTTEDSFLSHAAQIIRENFMAYDPDNLTFNVMAFGPN